jgi:hypothetical protein
MRQIDQQSPIGNGLSRYVVPSTAHSNQKVVLASEAHRLNDIRRAGATHHKRRVLVDSRIPDCSGLIVAEVTGQESLTSQSGTERVERFRRDRCDPPIQLVDLDFIHFSLP